MFCGTARGAACLQQLDVAAAAAGLSACLLQVLLVAHPLPSHAGAVVVVVGAAAAVGPVWVCLGVCVCVCMFVCMTLVLA